MSSPRSRPTAICLAIGLLAPASAAAADRLVLEGGGTIRVERWWVEGDRLVYEGPAGTVSLPRSLVVRIEPAVSRADDAPSSRRETPPPSAGTRPDGAGEDPDAERFDRLFEQGLAALARSDFRTASSRFHEALIFEPASAAARVSYAVSEMAQGRDEMALPVILEGLVRTPREPDLHEVLGDLRNREERVDDALRAWREAFRLRPHPRVRDKIEKGERELRAGRHYAFSAAPHFNLRYDGQLEAGLAEDIAEFLEARFRELADLYRHAPPRAITVLLYPTQEFREVTQAGETVGGLYDGKIRVPLGGLRRLDDRLRRVLAHELAHAIVHSKSRGNCPRWLHEGLAQRAEGKSLSPPERRELAALLRSVPAEAWETRGLSYPAALSLTNHLESRRGHPGLVELLDRLAEGAALDDALQRVYGERYADLCRGWAARVLAAEPR